MNSNQHNESEHSSYGPCSECDQCVCNWRSEKDDRRNRQCESCKEKHDEYHDWQLAANDEKDAGKDENADQILPVAAQRDRQAQSLLLFHFKLTL
jgi:hypothetical protein